MSFTVRVMPMMDEEAIRLEQEHPEKVIRWGVKHYENIALACSFGAEDIVLVDMLQQIAPEADIFYLDTDLHFRETYETKERLEEKYGIRFIRVASELTLEEQAAQYGDALWERDPNQCCYLRKVAPLSNVLQSYDAWITGIRREQSFTRANAKKVEYDDKFHLTKLNPLADWRSEQVWDYIREHELYYNPLHDRGFPSIGCEKCTRAVRQGEDPRSGRWADFAKTECGLHK